MDPTWIQQVADLMTKGEYVRAAEILQDEVTRTPQDWRLYDHLGAVCRSSGDHTGAVNHLSNAAWILMQQATAPLGSDAVACFEEVSTESGTALFVLRPACFDDARPVLAASTDFARLRNDTGLSLLELGEVATARRLLCEAVEFLPPGSDYEEPWLWLTRIESL